MAIRARGFRPHPHVEGQTVALNHAARGGDGGHAGHVRLRFVPVQRLLGQQGNAAVHIAEHGAPRGRVAVELQAQVAHFAHRAAGHLRRFVLVGFKLGQQKAQFAQGRRRSGRA